MKDDRQTDTNTSEGGLERGEKIPVWSPNTNTQARL